MNDKNSTYDPFKLLTVNNLKTQEYIGVKNCDYSQKLYEDFYNLFISFNDLSKTVLERISLLEERIGLLEDKLLSADKI
jgi:hypothetical protein